MWAKTKIILVTLDIHIAKGKQIMTKRKVGPNASLHALGFRLCASSHYMLDHLYIDQNKNLTMSPTLMENRYMQRSLYL